MGSRNSWNVIKSIWGMPNFLQSRLFPLSSCLSSLISQNNPVEPWSHSWDLGAQLSFWNLQMSFRVVNTGVGPKNRRCHHSLPKAVVCHHQGQKIQWDLVLICLCNFLYQLLIFIQLLKGWGQYRWELPWWAWKRSRGCMHAKVIWVLFHNSSISLLWAVDFSRWQ